MTRLVLRLVPPPTRADLDRRLAELLTEEQPEPVECDEALFLRVKLAVARGEVPAESVAVDAGRGPIPVEAGGRVPGLDPGFFSVAAELAREVLLLRSGASDRPRDRRRVRVTRTWGPPGSWSANPAIVGKEGPVLYTYQQGRTLPPDHPARAAADPREQVVAWLPGVGECLVEPDCAEVTPPEPGGPDSQRGAP